MADTKALLFLSGWSGLGHADISALVGKTLSSQEQTLCGTLISSIELYICQQTRRQFKVSESDNYYEILDAGHRSYHFKNYPVSSVVKILLDNVIVYGNADASDDTLVLGTDFFVYEGKIVFNSSMISAVNNRNAVKIYYRLEQFWGEDAKLAVKRWVADLLLTREYGTKGVNSFNVSGGLSLSFDSKSIPDYVETVISQYKKMLI